MVLVRGLDRTDDNESLFGMPDDLWKQHVDEIQREFSLLPEGSLGFRQFCYLYYTKEKTTLAMRIYEEIKVNENQIVNES